MEFIAWFGKLIINDQGDVEDCQAFEKDPGKLAEMLVSMQKTVQNKAIAAPDLRHIALEFGFVELDDDYDILLRDVCIRAAKMQISKSDTDDTRIIQAVEAMDDIDRNVNELSERLMVWYGRYFPELTLTGESLANFVMQYGSRDSLPEDHKLFEKASNSMGSDISFADEELLRQLASNICSLYDTRRHIEAYIISNMGTVAPNLSNIAGAPLGARLISMAGSLEKLAAFPSSTVQVIGASRALFKHLRARAPSPKHGIIFNNTIIKNAPWWQRGKLARAFAAKISLAARMDCYSGELDPSIKDNLEKKLERIRQANPSPPKREKGSKSGNARSGRSGGSGASNKKGGNRKPDNKNNGGKQ